METVELVVEPRDKNLKSKGLLAQGIIPIEYYGRGIDNKSLQVEAKTFNKVYRLAGESTIIELSPGDGKKYNVLVHDIQLNPVTDEVIHVDLINVKMDQEIHTRIPLEFVGQAPATREGGILMTQIDELEVKCLPKDLVHCIEVSIESLIDFNASIHVKDIIVPNGIQVLNDLEQTVAAVAAPAKEEEEPVEEVAGPESGEVAETTPENKEQES